MDTVFARAVTKIIEMPAGTQRVIGEALLDGAGQPNLPVIEFTAEEEAKIEEGLASLERGDVYSQEQMEEHFDKLSARAYAAV